MNRADRDQWCAALRSGDYRQGRGQLFSLEKNTYCCFGVLCDLHDGIDGRGYTEEGFCKCPSQEFLKKVGVSDGQVRAAVILNDDMGHNFQKIAEWIEKKIEVDP